MRGGKPRQGAPINQPLVCLIKVEGGKEGGKQSWGRPPTPDIAPGTAPAQSIHDGRNGLVREVQKINLDETTGNL